MKKQIIDSGKHIIKSIPLLHSSAKKLKSRLVAHIDYERSQREIYNLSSFYPSIQEYYDQTHDSSQRLRPLISILMPTYNTPETYLRECIESILVQSYENWELCIADDCSTESNVIRIIEEYIKKDSRIKLVQRKKNGHISESTNSALEIATGEFVALMDHDDVLWPNALYEIVKVINKNPSVDHIYTDEDKIDGTGLVHSYPFLKPDMNHEFLESCNYITHFSCIRKSVMQDIGGCRKGYEGAQDWDLFIRIARVTENIIHIPRILYSWRIHENSTASDTDAKPYVYEAQKKLLDDHVSRGAYAGVVKKGIITQHRTVMYDIPSSASITVLIHGTSESATKGLLESMSNNDAGANFDIVYIGNKGLLVSFSALIKEILPGVDFRLESASKLCANPYLKLAECESQFLLFVKDFIRFTTIDWAKLFIADIQRSPIGCVGPLILDGNDTQKVLSAGLGMGYGDGRRYLDMLQGMPVQDDHYTRGLYVKSRRNVTAVNPAIFATNIDTAKLLGESSPIDWMLNMYGTKRIVYTPYIQVSTDSLPKYDFNTNFDVDYEDPMLNPAFRKDNPRMEVTL